MISLLFVITDNFLILFADNILNFLSKNYVLKFVVVNLAVLITISKINEAS